MSNAQHNRTRYQALQQQHAAAAPFCACGCGDKVLWDLYKHKYKTYLFGHHHKRVGNIALTDRQQQIIAGTLLGDGSLSATRNRITKAPTSARLRIRHSTKRQTEYTNWLWRELEPICGTPPKPQPNRGYGREVITFNTLAHPWLLELYNRLYTPIKTVTRQYLDSINELGLATWWMDDGSTDSLSTHCFTQQEQQVVLEWFKDRWDLTFSLGLDKRVNKNYIKLRQPDLFQLLTIIFPHLHTSLWYKVGRFLPRLLNDTKVVV